MFGPETDQNPPRRNHLSLRQTDLSIPSVTIEQSQAELAADEEGSDCAQ